MLAVNFLSDLILKQFVLFFTGKQKKTQQKETHTQWHTHTHTHRGKHTHISDENVPPHPPHMCARARTHKYTHIQRRGNIVKKHVKATL